MLAAACASAVGMVKPATSPPGSPAGLETFYQQKLLWSGCKDGLECATLKVPRDYGNPGGGELKIAVIRLSAPVKSRRIGSLVTDPGGPGVSGVDFIRDVGRSFGQPLRDRFDLIGFDPRGVGRSDPVRCLDSPQVEQGVLADPPATQTEINAQAAAVKAFVAGCQYKSGANLPYVGTMNAARDMDVLRAALGDKRLTYLGFSYGTYLGAFYADQFPQNVRALVLDGAVDPKLMGEEYLLGHIKALETALRAFAADCVKISNCPLGTGSVDQALNKVSDLQQQADRKPLKNRKGDRIPVNEDRVTLGLYVAVSNRQSWPVLRQALTQAINAGDGTTFSEFTSGTPEARNFITGGELLAVDCVDKLFPTDLTAFRQLADRAKKVAPRFGSLVWLWMACTYWPAKTTRQPRALAADGAPPIVVIGTTRDSRTPYEWAQSLAGQLKSGVLLSYDGDGHTAYLLNNEKCIRQPVENYLINGQPPKAGTRCKQTLPKLGSKGRV
jgi:pimeloyl-ACP methyl ester carboxylesterase